MSRASALVGEEPPRMPDLSILASWSFEYKHDEGGTDLTVKLRRAASSLANDLSQNCELVSQHWPLIKLFANECTLHN